MKLFNPIFPLSIIVSLSLPARARANEVAVFPDSVDEPPSIQMPYEDYRARLIESDWRPDIEGGSGPFKNYPEIKCGSTLCTTGFISPSGRKSLIIVISGRRSNGKFYFNPRRIDVFERHY